MALTTRLAWLTAAAASCLMAACSGPSFELPSVTKPPDSKTPSPRLREPVAWRLSPQDAQDILRRTRMLVLHERSRQVQAFNVTFEQPDARRRFQFVADRGELAGRMYALCALAVLDADKARSLARTLSAERGTVSVFDAGVLTEPAVSGMVNFVQTAAAFSDLRALKAP